MLVRAAGGLRVVNAGDADDLVHEVHIEAAVDRVEGHGGDTGGVQRAAPSAFVIWP